MLWRWWEHMNSRERQRVSLILELRNTFQDTYTNVIVIIYSREWQKIRVMLCKDKKSFISNWRSCFVCLVYLTHYFKQYVSLSLNSFFLAPYGNSCHLEDCFAWLNSWSPPAPNRITGPPFLPPFLFKNLISPDTSKQ